MIRRSGGARRGKVLALFLLLLPVLLGMIGLVVDVGLLLVAHRQVQHVADAAALSVATDRLASRSVSEAQERAEQLVVQSSGMANATLTLSIPPTEGAYEGNQDYSEVVVTVPVHTYFIQALGLTNVYTVGARAVAGEESRALPETVVALDPEETGLSIAGGTLQVQGRVAINSQRGGSLGLPGTAVTTASGLLQANRVRVVGDVDVPDNIQPLTGDVTPLRGSELLVSDPLLYLPTPTTTTGVQSRYPGLNGQFYGTPQTVVVNLATAGNVTLVPGIYTSITISGNASGSSVTFDPGIYILCGGGLAIVTAQPVTASGVLFYNSGDDYDATTGAPDKNDRNTPLAGTPTATFGAIRLQASQLTLSPLNDTSSPFHGLCLYQRRGLRQTLDVSTSTFAGTIYARWGTINLSGSGSYPAQLIAGKIVVTCTNAQTPLALTSGGLQVKARQAYLVE